MQNCQNKKGQTLVCGDIDFIMIVRAFPTPALLPKSHINVHT